MWFSTLTYSLPFDSFKTVGCSKQEFSLLIHCERAAPKRLKDLLKVTELMPDSSRVLCDVSIPWLPTSKGSNKEERRLRMWKHLAHFVTWKHHATSSSARPEHTGGGVFIESYSLALACCAPVFQRKVCWHHKCWVYWDFLNVLCGKSMLSRSHHHLPYH